MSNITIHTPAAYAVEVLTPQRYSITIAAAALRKRLLVADRGEAGDPISGSNQFYLPTAEDYTIFIGTAPIHEGIDYTRTGNLITLTEEYGDLAPQDKILLLI